MPEIMHVVFILVSNCTALKRTACLRFGYSGEVPWCQHGSYMCRRTPTPRG